MQSTVKIIISIDVLLLINSGYSHLVRLIGEVHLVEDLSGLALNGIYLHQVGRVTTGAGTGGGGRKVSYYTSTSSYTF